MTGKSFILRTENLRKSFGRLTAIEDVSLAIGKGELRAIIGPNGAGKSTLLRLIFGELKATRGRVFLKGKDVTNKTQVEISRLGVAKSYQLTNIFSHLTTLENVRVAVQRRFSTYNFWASLAAVAESRDIAERVLAMVGLTDHAGQLAGNLSHGQQRSLEIGIALANEPEILLLDEPTAGMGPEETSRSIRLIQRIATEYGLTIVLIEHKMQVVEAIAERVTVLNYGQILAEGTMVELRENPKVHEAYFCQK